MITYLMLLETEAEREYFRIIYEENYLKMYHIALGYLKQATEAENIVHEAFLILAEKFQKYSHLTGREMTGFCVSIVKNKSIDVIRKRNRYSEEELESLELEQNDETRDPEHVLMDEETKHLIEKALAQVSEVFRETLVLKYVYEMSNKEISRIQGVPVKTVTMRIYRGKQQLKEIIHEEDIL